VISPEMPLVRMDFVLMEQRGQFLLTLVPSGQIHPHQRHFREITISSLRPASSFAKDFAVTLIKSATSHPIQLGLTCPDSTRAMSSKLPTSRLSRRLPP